MFNFSEVKEQSSTKYLKHGVNPNVTVQSVDLVDVATANYNGKVIDVVFTNPEGAIANWRIFPFKYNPTLKDKKKGTHIDEAKQLNNYQANIKHVFTKVFGEENFGKLANKVKTFEELGKSLKLGITKANIPFYLMLVDKDGYAKVPSWAGNFASEKDDLFFDAKKYGKAEAPTSGLETPASSNGQLDFLGELTTPPADSTPEEDDSELPF